MKKSLGGLVSNFLIMSYIVENWITVDAPKREVMDLISERYEQGQNLWAGMIQFGRATARELESA